MGSSGSHPHLSHLNWGTPAGFLEPHSLQNFPLLTVPQLHTHPSGVISGFLEPHSGQNFPVTEVPQEGQIQLPAAGFGSGFFVPHSGQNFPEATAPQLQVHEPSADAAGACG